MYTLFFSYWELKPNIYETFPYTAHLHFYDLHLILSNSLSTRIMTSTWYISTKIINSDFTDTWQEVLLPYCLALTLQSCIFLLRRWQLYRLWQSIAIFLFTLDRYVVCALYKNAADLMPEGANNVNNRFVCVCQQVFFSFFVFPFALRKSAWVSQI